MLEKIQASVSGIEDNMSTAVSNLEARLDVMEGQAINQYTILNTVIPGCVNETPVIDETEQDLITINKDTLSRLREEDQPVETSPSSVPQEVGEELILSCVTPTKIKTVQQTLGKESERHLCALKLLRNFFSKDELATSNTDGTYDKKCLDSNKLNSLKILVFTKFPVSTNEEKDRAWRFIKGKINSKCRTTRKSLVKDFIPPARSL
ncbi:hypothetical protein OS493_036115 [Desmophyllum pertusum]|uniref:BEN domain-containing protein n=1 Tax=Desmophyllum pertusum TaxID=174260 RepID=A0A9W9Y8X7_9CNID|nr:hypothetical protein OS493_036115 [Desmophyllum pertusum]